MTRYTKTFLNNSKNIDLVSKKYGKNFHNATINITIEEHCNYQQLNIKTIETTFYQTINDIKFDYEIFREAYINQRKQYKLLKAYLELKNELINEEEYDLIENDNIIDINNYDYNITHKAIYRFLKKHQNYIQDYEANELSEILGLPYETVNKILKNRKNNG